MFFVTTPLAPFFGDGINNNHEIDTGQEPHMTPSRVHVAAIPDGEALYQTGLN